MASTAIDIIVPDCDLDDVEACRGKVIAAIEDQGFKDLLDGIQTANTSAQDAPMPRSWGVTGSVDGETTVAGVKVKVKVGAHIDNKP